jgi:PAS domain S-box-containing protein
VVCVAQDITARKAAETRLAENEARYRRISLLSSDYAFSAAVTADGSVQTDWVFGAFQRITGFTPEEISSERDQVWQRLIHPADRPLFDKTLHDMLANGGDYEHELRLIARSGEVRHLRIRYHAAADPASGRVYRIYGATEDITARKQAQLNALEAMLQTERVRLLSEFIRDISHDVRTPLTAIHTSLYLLRRLDDDPERRDQHYDRIEQQAARLQELLEAMLTLARLDQDEGFEFRTVDVNAAVTDVSSRMGPLVEARHLTLTHELHPDLPLIQADKDELQRALLNLLGNAVRFTPEAGAVTVRTAARADHVLIEVQDTGVGIAPADQERIFERFYRAEPSRSSKTGGAGLGLAITRKIVERHGGTIELDSEPGVGSTFRVLLPLTPVRETAVRQPNIS